jgi:hypothetical protein
VFVFHFFGQIFREISQIIFFAKVFEITLKKKIPKFPQLLCQKLTKLLQGKKEVVGTFSK